MLNVGPPYSFVGYFPSRNILIEPIKTAQNREEVIFTKQSNI